MKFRLGKIVVRLAALGGSGVVALAIEVGLIDMKMYQSIINSALGQ
jgi:hypothetical protein